MRGEKGLVTQDAERMLCGKHFPGCGECPGTSGHFCVCVWEVGEATTGSSSQPWSTAYSSQCGRTFHEEPLLLKRLRNDCEDAPNPEEDTQGLPLRVSLGQGIPGGRAESITSSGHLVTRPEGSVFEAAGSVTPYYR